MVKFELCVPQLCYRKRGPTLQRYIHMLEMMCDQPPDKTITIVMFKTRLLEVLVGWETLSSSLTPH